MIEIIKKEYNRIQSDKALNVDVTAKIINSNDRLVITAFNQDRTEQMKEILLKSEYVRSHTRIGNDSKADWKDWLKSVENEKNG